MIKAFISQPMNGKTDEEILKERQKAKDAITLRFGEEVEFIDSFFQEAPYDAKPLWYLGKSLQMMSEADVVCFVGDWEEARGCRMEHRAAVSYGITIMYAY